MRTKNSLFNMITSLLPSLIIPVVSMVKLGMLIRVYGEDIYGMNMYLVQVMSYLNLIEGGFGFAFVQSLFKPLAEKDETQVNRLYQGANYILKIIGLAILGIGILVLIGLPWLLNTNLDFTFVRTVFILMVVPTVIDYFLMAPSLVLQADQKEYYLNIVRKGVQILRAISHIVIIYLELNYLFIPLIEAVYLIIQIFVIRRIVFKKYPYLKKKESRDFSSLSNARYIFAHKMSGVVVTSTDTLLLGKLIGTSANALYGNYNYIVTQLQLILESIVNAPKSSLGNLFVSEDREKGHLIFKELFNFTSYLASCAAITLCITANKFVYFWQGENYVLTLFDCVLFSGILYFILVRQPIMLVRDTNGLFKESKKFAYMEAIFKAIFSFVGIYYFGITGALIATFILYFVSDIFMNSILVYNTIFKLNVFDYYKMYLSKLALMLVVGFGMNWLWSNLLVNYVSSLVMWFVLAGTLFVLVCAILLVLYFVLFSDFRKFIQRVKHILVNR